jgi:tRNA threonylcarbamoyladenosine biosynthesis protein TsaB
VIVLGFDTATPATTVALRLADGTTLRARHDPLGTERPVHTTRLLGLAAELLAQAGMRWGELQRLAVGVGPGTFTGLRIGVATARGLSQSLGVPVVGGSTPRVLAESALRAQDRAVLAVIDARRGEAFASAYAPMDRGATDRGHRPTFEGNGFGGVGAAERLLAPVALAPPDLASIPGRIGGGRDWLAVGDGAVRFRAHLEAAGVTVPADSSELHRVDAGMLCELALDVDAGELEAVAPDYRRRPDAEIALEQAGSGK